MRNLQVRALTGLIIYILIQGMFLPLLLRMDRYWDAGQGARGWLCFALYELLIITDAMLYWLIFLRNK